MTPEERSRIRALARGGARLECWFASARPFGQFDAPELRGPIRVSGTIGGKEITTSAVVRAEGRTFWTRGGGRYTVGDPDPLYVAWLARLGRALDPDDPDDPFAPPAPR